jgi:hypothetical protein
MLCRLADDKIFIASNDGEEYFSFACSGFAHIASICADETSQSVVVTAAEDAADVADVMANKRGNYRAYRVAGNGSVRLTEEYTNTAVPLPDGSIAYSNGANLVVRSGSDRRAWKTGKFSWGPVAISCNADASVIAMTKWKGDHRKLFTVERESGIANTSTFSYYSYALSDRIVYYALGGGVKSLSLDSGETGTLTGSKFLKVLLALFGSAEPPSSVRTDIGSITLFQGRLLASVWQSVFRGNELMTLGRAVIAWTPAQTDIQIVQNVGDEGTIDGLWSNGETVIVSIASPVGLAPKHTYRRYAFGRSAALIDAGWNLTDVPSLPNHGFQFLPSLTKKEIGGPAGPSGPTVSPK